MQDGIFFAASTDDSPLRISYVNDLALAMVARNRVDCIGAELTDVLADGTTVEPLRAVLHTASRQREACVVRIASRATPDVRRRLTLTPIDTRESRDEWLVSLEEPNPNANARNRDDAVIDLVSHELRSPLNSALTWVSLMEIDRSEKTVERAVEVIKKSIHDQARLVDDLIEVARAGRRDRPLDTQPLDLGDVIESAVNVYRAQAPANVRIDCVERVRATLDGDETKLCRALHHLLDNATKFMPEGGTISVRTRLTAGYVSIDVCDEGIGLAQDEVAHTFELFWRARAKSRGGGLGLGVVMSVVERHRGFVAARSAGVGRGATFTVVLPINA